MKLLLPSFELSDEMQKTATDALILEDVMIARHRPPVNGCIKLAHSGSLDIANRERPFTYEVEGLGVRRTWWNGEDAGWFDRGRFLDEEQLASIAHAEAVVKALNSTPWGGDRHG